MVFLVGTDPRSLTPSSSSNAASFLAPRPPPLSDRSSSSSSNSLTSAIETPLCGTPAPTATPIYDSRARDRDSVVGAPPSLLLWSSSRTSTATSFSDEDTRAPASTVPSILSAKTASKAPPPRTLLIPPPRTLLLPAPKPKGNPKELNEDADWELVDANSPEDPSPSPRQRARARSRSRSPRKPAMSVADPHRAGLKKQNSFFRRFGGGGAGGNNNPPAPPPVSDHVPQLPRLSTFLSDQDAPLLGDANHRNAGGGAFMDDFSVTSLPKPMPLSKPQQLPALPPGAGPAPGLPPGAAPANQAPIRSPQQPTSPTGDRAVRPVPVANTSSAFQVRSRQQLAPAMTANGSARPNNSAGPNSVPNGVPVGAIFNYPNGAPAGVPNGAPHGVRPGPPNGTARPPPGAMGMRPQQPYQQPNGVRPPAPSAGPSSPTRPTNYQQQASPSFRPPAARAHWPPPGGAASGPTSPAGPRSPASTAPPSATQRAMSPPPVMSQRPMPQPPPGAQRAMSPPMVGQRAMSPPMVGQRAMSPPLAGQRAMSPPLAGQRTMPQPPPGAQRAMSPPSMAIPQPSVRPQQPFAPAPPASTAVPRPNVIPAPSNGGTYEVIASSRPTSPPAPRPLPRFANGRAPNLTSPPSSHGHQSGYVTPPSSNQGHSGFGSPPSSHGHPAGSPPPAFNGSARPGLPRRTSSTRGTPPSSLVNRSPPAPATPGNGFVSQPVSQSGAQSQQAPSASNAPPGRNTSVHHDSFAPTASETRPLPSATVPAAAPAPLVAPPPFSSPPPTQPTSTAPPTSQAQPNVGRTGTSLPPIKQQATVPPVKPSRGLRPVPTPPVASTSPGIKPAAPAREPERDDNKTPVPTAATSAPAVNHNTRAVPSAIDPPPSSTRIPSDTKSPARPRIVIPQKSAAPPPQGVPIPSAGPALAAAVAVPFVVKRNPPPDNLKSPVNIESKPSTGPPSHLDVSRPKDPGTPFVDRYSADRNSEDTPRATPPPLSNLGVGNGLPSSSPASSQLAPRARSATGQARRIASSPLASPAVSASTSPAKTATRPPEPQSRVVPPGPQLTTARLLAKERAFKDSFKDRDSTPTPGSAIPSTPSSAVSFRSISSVMDRPRPRLNRVEKTLTYLLSQPRIAMSLLPYLNINSFLNVLGSDDEVRKHLTGEMVGRWVMREWGVTVERDRSRSWPGLTVWEGFLESLLHDPAVYSTYPPQYHNLLRHLSLSHTLIVLFLRTLPASAFPYAPPLPFEDDLQPPPLHKSSSMGSFQSPRGGSRTASVNGSEGSSMGGAMPKRTRVTEVIMPEPLSASSKESATPAQTFSNMGSTKSGKIHRRRGSHGSISSIATASGFGFGRKRSNSTNSVSALAAPVVHPAQPIPQGKAVFPPVSYPTAKRYEFRRYGEPHTGMSPNGSVYNPSRPGSIMSAMSSSAQHGNGNGNSMVAHSQQGHGSFDTLPIPPPIGGGTHNRSSLTSSDGGRSSRRSDNGTASPVHRRYDSPTYNSRYEPAFDRPPPFMTGRAPILRVFVPLSNTVRNWPSADAAAAAWRELEKCGANKRMRLGDLVVNTALHKPVNTEHVLIYVPFVRHKLVPLEYVHNKTGHLPRYLDAFALSPTYYDPFLPPPQILYLDFAPYAEQAMRTLRLAYDRRDLTVSSGARVSAKRYVHVAGLEINPGDRVAPEWHGMITLESEGTAEGRAEMEACFGGGDPSRAVMKAWELVHERSMLGSLWLRLIKEPAPPRI